MLVLSGCLIYDEEVFVDDETREVEHAGTPSGEDSDTLNQPGEDPGQSDGSTPQDEDPEPPGLSVFPSGGATGETVIVSVVVDVDRTADFDMTLVTGVTIYGPSDIEILVDQDRDLVERLLVVQIGAESPVGTNDVLVEFDDGSAIYLTDAFDVVEDSSDAPADHYAGDACE
jgi:hypothetical protein